MEIPASQQKHGKIIIYSLVAALIGFTLIGPLVGFLFAIPFFDGSMLSLVDAIANPVAYPQVKTAYYVIQSCTTTVGLLVLPWLTYRAFNSEANSLFQWNKKENHYTFYAMLILMTFTFILIISPISVWNANLDLEPILGEAGVYLKNLEKKLEEVTYFLTDFDSGWQYLAGLVVIAILPAFAEEFVFRGVIQKHFVALTQNAHVGIWVSAILFSAFHMQFFGFFPRMLLGVLFGYIFYWTGSLWLAIFAHFCNNAIALSSIYFAKLKWIDDNVNNSNESAPWFIVLFGSIIVVFLLNQFYHFHKQKNFGSASEIQ